MLEKKRRFYHNTSVKGAGEAAVYEIIGTNSQLEFVVPTSISKG